MSKARPKSQSRVEMRCPSCGTTFLPDLKEKQARAGASARRKGSNFERTIAKKFKKWWPGDYEWKRTPQSGGSALKKGWDLAGDVCTTAPDFEFHLELKNSPGSFKGLHQWFNHKSPLWKWLDQAESDCPTNKTPLLIFNRFDQPTYCASIQTEYDIQGRLDRAMIKHIVFWSDAGVIVYTWYLQDMLESDPEIWK